jgi:hypothetical protein
MVAAKLANATVGRNWANLPDKTTNEQAAALLNVGRASVERAKTVQRDQLIGAASVSCSEIRSGEPDPS